MKKIFIVIFIILIALVLWAAIFIATFDINKYNKALASQIETAVGNPVDIGHISLQWSGKLALNVEKFNISVQEGGVKVPQISFDRADMALELMPLLKKQVKISSITIDKLSMHIIRSKDGTVQVNGYSPKTEAKPAPQAAKEPPADISFNVDAISIKDSSVRFQDFAADPATDIVIQDIDADFKNVSMDGPVDFIVKMAALASKQNISISGTAGGFQKAPMYIKNLNVDTDLASIDHAKLIKAVPSVEKLGIGKDLAGALNVKVNELKLVNNKIENVSADVTFSNGKVSVSQLKVPVENINLSAIAEGNKISVKSFQADISNAALKSSADIQDIYGAPKTSAHIGADVPEVKKFCAALMGGKQYLDGKISLTFDGTMTGATQDEILKTLSGSGVFTLDNGVLLDTNIIRQSLGALSMFPGLTESLRSYIPAQIKESLDRDYTLLKPMRQQFTIKDGVVALSDLNVGTDVAVIKASANMTLNGELSGSGYIGFTPALSESITKAVPQMSYLADSSKVISFPINFKASGAGVSVAPDLEYVGKKVLVQKGQEVINDLLKKVGEKTSEQPAGTAAAATTDQSKTSGSNFDSLLSKIKTLTAEQEQAKQ